MRLVAISLGHMVRLEDAPAFVAVFDTDESDDPNIQRSKRVAEIVPLFGNEPSRVRLVRHENVHKGD
jgi:hypothetical protein